MIGCERFGEDLGAYHDRELSADRSALLETHLHECAACAAALERLSTLDGSMGALPTPTASPQFEARLWARIAASEHRPEPLWRRLLRGPRPLLLASASAAAALLLYVAAPDAPERDLLIVADDETLELLLEADLELISSLEVLEAWESPEGV